jgi:hypothetical protein
MAFTINGTTGINLGTQPLTGSLPDANAPVGSVLQVVQALSQAVNSTTSTTYVSTPITVSLTPISTSSKVLIQVSLGTSFSNNSSTTSPITVYRNSTDLATTVNGFALSSATGNLPVSFTFLDSPSTTSSTSYTVYFKTNSNTAYVGGTNGGVAVTNSITVTEIAG